MARRLDARYRNLALALLCALAVSVVVASGWWALRQSRSAIEDQVRVSQALAADERAATLHDVIEAARARLDLTISNPVVVGVLRSGDTALLRATLESATRGVPVTGVAVTDAAGNVLAESGQTPARPSGDMPVFRSSPDRTDAYLTLSAPIRDGNVTIAMAYQELSLRALSPHFVSPFSSFAGTGSLVARDGTIVLTTESGEGAQGPELAAMLASGKKGSGSYYSPISDSNRVVAVHPIEGTELAVVVSADADAASKPATALVTRFAGLFLLTFVALTALVGGAVVLLASLRRDLVRAREAAAAMARTDALTEVGNRRSLDVLQQELEESDELVGLVLIDVDDLKTLNDTCGHSAGDDALRRIAQAITAVVRGSDLVCRIGGDEFLVVLSDRGSARAPAIAASIETTVQSIQAEHFDGLSVSTGVDVCRGRELHYGINRADDMLYKAKRAKQQARSEAERARSVDPV